MSVLSFLFRIFKILVFAIFALAFLALLVLVGSMFVIPFLSDVAISNLSENSMYKILTPFRNPKFMLVGLGILVYIASFFILVFSWMKNLNVLTRCFWSVVVFYIYIFILSVLLESRKEMAYILLFIPLFVAIGIVVVNLRRKKVRKNKTKKKVKQTDDSFVFALPKGEIILNNPYRGIYIQGGAGSGKSVSVFEPIIQQISDKGFTGLLYDFKSPELTKKLFALYQSNTNISSYFVDFKNPYISHRVNPIEPKYLQKTAFAIEYATVLINNLLPESIKKMDYWNSNSKMILAGVIWFLRNKHPHYCSLPHVISLLLHSDVDKLINEISSDPEAGGMVVSLKQGIDRGAEKQVAGILSTIQNALSQLNTPDIFWILSGDDLDLHLNDPNNPKFLCLGNDSTLASTYAPIISLIISVSIRLMNQPNQVKSVVLLDEAPTIYIPNIEQVPATARSNKVATVFGVQDYSQLVDKYGQDKAQVILSNLGNQFYGRTVNVKSAEMIKNLFGKHDKTYQTTSRGSGSSGQFIHMSSNTNKGVNESIQERERVKISDITNLEAGQFYGIIAEGTPSEFLQTQFVPSGIEGTSEFTIKATEEQMATNYLKIVEEAKSIVF